ncbi:hypothetical protein N657DRAFT_677280 [Parathielavia appendiculata]|uniref:Uncharacterized protein n=1 Tax=Parathielavia appendiculata TaxID=2587402 RepID=A0AAN6UBW7_9PEZI|nr:hypothetical protein N657DRAFT_677280 [Parathielavia appendiculata]
MTSESTPSNFPPGEVAQAVSAARAAKRLQDAADTLRAQAAAIKDPAERERLFQAAYNKEVEARGQSKKARLMASGWGQGAAAGIGASGALGMGLGNLVGVLLSGVVAIPGVLVGAGAGAIHGPWYKLPGKSSKSGKSGEAGESVESVENGALAGSQSDEEEHRIVIAAARQIEGEEKAKEKDKGADGEDREEKLEKGVEEEKDDTD